MAISFNKFVNNSPSSLLQTALPGKIFLCSLGYLATVVNGFINRTSSTCSSPSLVIPLTTEQVAHKPTNISLSFGKLKNGSDEANYRIQHDKMIKEKRWEWIQENPEEYVNLLRKAGLTDTQITAMSERKYPLAFKNKAQYLAYTEDLFRTLQSISDSTGIKNFRAVQQGSYVTGYSSNPRKGDRWIPNHIYNKDSDIDLRISAENIEDYLSKKQFQVKDYYPELIEPDSLKDIFPSLQAFTDRWAKELGAPIQITIFKKADQDFEPTPWDWEL